MDVILFDEVVLKEVQDVPDLPEPTLSLSFQIELSDDATNQNESFPEFLTAIH